VFGAISGLSRGVNSPYWKFRATRHHPKTASRFLSG
jgi:hypothetical protein